MARRTRTDPVSSTRTLVVQAPRALVYEVVTDRERYGEFMALTSILEAPGQSERQGVGAVHFLGQGRFGVREQITELVPGRRMSYEVRSGLPTAAHRGWAVLTDAPSGTHLTYTMQNVPGRVPRRIVALLLPLSVRTMTRAVQKEAERRASAAISHTNDH